MAKQVLLSITGNQFTGEGHDSIELVTVANYYKRNGRHFLLYEEAPEGEESVIKNTLKFDRSFFEMSKKGAVNTQLLFRPEQDTITYYTTPAGPMTVGVTTTEYMLEETEHYLQVYIQYVLEINHSYTAENEILLRVAPQ